ncbi:hypothetical protein [Streptomyces sp. NPDC059874]|uniref:hypothetical protein n=1 Tax=Streptomyces sp. NPDC059874 TaxID=3346983 RepID=UPI0036555250
MNEVGEGPRWQPEPWPLDEREWQKPPMSRSTKRGIGCAIGVLGMVLAPPALVAMLLGGRAMAPGAPEGEPLVLAKEALVGNWDQEGGGTLVLAADGTFTATDVCGDFSGEGKGVGRPAGRRPWPARTGTGTWDASDSQEDDGRVTVVRVGFGDGGATARYEARGSVAAQVLWAQIGDPDDGRVCVLKKQP